MFKFTIDTNPLIVLITFYQITTINYLQHFFLRCKIKYLLNAKICCNNKRKLGVNMVAWKQEYNSNKILYHDIYQRCYFLHRCKSLFNCPILNRSLHKILFLVNLCFEGVPVSRKSLFLRSLRVEGISAMKESLF